MKAIVAVFAVVLLALTAAPALSQWTDTFDVQMVEGTVIGGGASGLWPDWYYYTETQWWNVWFEDGEYIPGGNKYIRFNMLQARGLMGMMAGELIVYVNSSTGDWDEMQFEFPPLPEYVGYDEWLYIRRDSVGVGTWDPDSGATVMYPVGLDWEPLPVQFEIVIPGNPEWISIDIMGTNVELQGEIEHECASPVEHTSWGKIKTLYR